jgi:hippurate hydrolase
MTDLTAPAPAAPFAPGPGFLAQLQDLRRHLHRIPEIGLQLPQTQAAVLEAIKDLDLEITLGTETSSVIGVLRGGKPGPVVLLRGDMDALPVTELTGLPYASTNGAMHACGHDLHVAGLVGAARLLAARRDEIPGTVLFMFQPGEEGHDGAGVMLREGLLEAAGERPVAAYGIHVASDQPYGEVYTRPGTLMAAYSVLEVHVIGRGGHASRPFRSLDPIPAAAEMVTALQTHVTRRFNVFDPIVITVGSFHAGSAPNIIPDDATFRAGVRTFTPEAVAQAAHELPALVRGIGEAHGLTVEAELREVLPATINDPEHTEIYLGTAERLFGADRVRVQEFPATGSEDFSRVLQAVPGAYGHIGAGVDFDPVSPPPSNHSPLAQFDDGVLSDQAVLLATLAWDRLQEAAGA